ncbi:MULTISPECIES: lysophospholipid acyltransferase family protein [Petrimonas]|jgi:1-acyl-sn-glycerol-3-phosphate acyltransferase|uniref:1-acyl-sn-glycerol-3-phosphate acyltransferase alpha n=2 Tax=Petrimonas mucosa TaxID=1642646 RepID=A0A1G4G705_9BACT|nr:MULTISPECIES: lysophospholipid acyltransferase family protein [Petrimonas]MDD3561519.1 lysophospholipid acyltransferase family protein [Petrimonas mucosa]SCM57719.1 1-acyl-sn-glycerol-3-phosphate acyltransferase alpha [Petrimonas mucosa]SFU48657.1 1-acyl-sn-glycerol-3-phosphate acyltransferase [Porphyromonadaceae bacterium KHP3R9]HHT29641.1 1-acyl-sn-glycerol-3-phosphate acyltransferase [Petrimonas mucosa]
MKLVKRVILFLYQWLIFAPIFIVITMLTALTVMAFAPLFGSRFWGYVPPRWWSRLTCWLALCRIKSHGHEHLDPRQSYVFVANHQGAFDIFLIYGFLNQNIKWVQKASLRKIPLVGLASEMAGHVFVDNSSAAARVNTIKEAEKKIINGVSIMLFPEGARTRTGKMGRFKRGAYQIAYDLKLPIVPLTLNGPFDVMKRGSLRLNPNRLELIIHKPISTENLSEEDIPALIEETREIIHADLWERFK